jgi:serine/threonine-protein kinase
LYGAVTATQVWVLTLQRKFSDALQALQKFQGDALNTIDGSIPKSFLEGSLCEALGDKSKAQKAFEQARIVAERLARESPDDASRHAILGQVLAALGQKDAAIAEGKRAVDLLPESEDAYGGPPISTALAQIYACTGEHDQALRLIDHLLEVPNGLCVPILKLDPVWDPLRKDPRFQTLIDNYAVTK